jgi:hypothetical protein
MFNNFFAEEKKKVNTEKYARARLATDDDIIRLMRIAYWIA